MARTPLVIGNWKMHTTLEEAAHLAGAVKRGIAEITGVEVAIAPPLPWLVPVGLSLGSQKKLKFAVQDASPGMVGPETGTVSFGMMVPYVAYAIVGHSERRLSNLDTHETINAKLRDAQKRGITPVLCVGEFVQLYSQKRKRGRPTKLEAASNIFMQLRKALRGVKESDLGKLVITYEPVWAISTSGTGQSADPAYANLMARKLRRSYARLAGQRRAGSIRILYGGSVSAANAAAYAAQPHIDGALVGAASLDANNFVQIIQQFAW